MTFADLSDEEIQVFQEKGQLMVAGHLLSGTDLKVGGATTLSFHYWVRRPKELTFNALKRRKCRWNGAREMFHCLP